MSQTNFDPVST